VFNILVAVSDDLGRVNIASRTGRAHLQSGKGDTWAGEQLDQRLQTGSLVILSSADEKDEGALSLQASALLFVGLSFAMINARPPR